MLDRVYTKDELLKQAGRMASTLDHMLNKKVCEIGYGNLIAVLETELDKYNKMIEENMIINNHEKGWD